eukprot:SAG11_NODE_10001_length_863_cov_1.344241_1_plen_130_part_10
MEVLRADAAQPTDVHYCGGGEKCGLPYVPLWQSKCWLPSRTFLNAVLSRAHSNFSLRASRAMLILLQWHLGDFFPKREYGEQMTFANAKWPVSNPGIHGFDEWVATEASGPSSTPNCGCMPDWKTKGQGC